MRFLAQSLADTFGVPVSHQDAAGHRKTAEPRPWQNQQQQQKHAERQRDRARQAARAVKRGQP